MIQSNIEGSGPTDYFSATLGPVCGELVTWTQARKWRVIVLLIDLQNHMFLNGNYLGSVLVYLFQ